MKKKILEDFQICISVPLTILFKCASALNQVFHGDVFYNVNKIGIYGLL